MKKIVFFQPYLANWRIQFLTRFISEAPYDVMVYDGGFKSKNDFKSVTGNAVTFNFRRLVSWSPILRYKGQSYPLYFSPFLFFRLVSDRPDVVVTEGEINFINNISVFIYCLLFRKKYVWWSLGKVRTRKKNIINRVFDPLIDFLIAHSNCVMARNSLAKRYYLESGKVSEEKVIVAPNSMDEKLARSEIDNDLVGLLRKDVTGPVILYVGALTSDKKPADLVRAFSLLFKQEEHKNCQLWFVGEGPEREILEGLTLSLELKENVKFFGKIFDGVGNYFKAADLVVVPGLGGLVINHAMIFGKPVISGLADGTEHDLIIPGETGYLLEANTVEDLAYYIKKALVPEVLEYMSVNAARKVDGFWNMSVMISRVQDCIEFS